MLFKLSNLNSNLVPTLGYLNPALNNLAQSKPPGRKNLLYIFSAKPLKTASRDVPPEQCRVKIAPGDKTEPGVRNLPGQGGVA